MTSNATKYPVVSIVVAAAENRVIGRDNDLPWKLPGDLKRFKALTTGHPIVMGRKTFDSIGRPLPNRANIVVTRQSDWQHEGVEVANNLASALELAKAKATALGVDEVMVIGGAQLYEQALPITQRIYFTCVNASIDGDAYFPEFDIEQWHEVSREHNQAIDGNSHSYTFLVLERLDELRSRC